MSPFIRFVWDMNGVALWRLLVAKTGALSPVTCVISDTGYSCGECEMCLFGQYQNWRKRPRHWHNSRLLAGGVSEYMLMPERLVFKVPDNVALDAAALIEPASIGLYGVERAGITPRKKLAVIAYLLVWVAWRAQRGRV